MANRINELRKKKDMTLLQIANYLGVSESTVQRYESGNIKNLKYETMVELAKILDCSPAYLMGWDDPSDQPADYYTDPDTARMAQEMYDDPEMRSLFHMKRNMDPDRFQKHMDMMKEMYHLEHPEDDIYGA